MTWTFEFKDTDQKYEAFAKRRTLDLGPDSGYVGRDWRLSHGTGTEWAGIWTDLILDMSIAFEYGVVSWIHILDGADVQTCYS